MTQDELGSISCRSATLCRPHSERPTQLLRGLSHPPFPSLLPASRGSTHPLRRDRLLRVRGSTSWLRKDIDIEVARCHRRREIRLSVWAKEACSVRGKRRPHTFGQKSHVHDISKSSPTVTDRHY